MKGLTRTGRTWALRGLVSAVAVAVLTATASAQDSTVAGGFRMHTVRAGESLWDIAQQFLGDGELWPEIVRANKRLVADSHWIFPNEVLRIPPRPAGAPADNGAALATQSAPSQSAPSQSAPSQPAASEPAATAPAAPAATEAATQPATMPEPQPASEVAAGAPPASDDAGAAATATTPDDAAASAPGATLFNHPPQGASMFAASSGGGSYIAHHREGVSPGDHNSAPYMDRDGGPQNAGAVVGVADMSNVVDAADVEHYGLDQELYIRLPRGAHPEVGQRYYTYTLDESFGDHGQIIVPTGIVLVTHAGTDKVATTARIVQEFAYIQLGQGVLPIDDAILPETRPAPLAGGTESRVLWVEHDQVLPTVGYFIVLDGSAKSGLRIGDQVTLYRPRKDLQSAQGDITLPEADIAVAQVVRVTPYGASAIIIHQDQPAVEPGVAARITARVGTGGQ